MVIFVVKHLKIPKSTVHVAFSVKDKPGSLAAALKVFKDCNIYILGLNTHLHHAEFDRSAGDGYQYNYVHCTCTKDEKEFLKNELKAELEGGKINSRKLIVWVLHKRNYNIINNNYP